MLTSHRILTPITLSSGLRNSIGDAPHNLSGDPVVTDKDRQFLPSGSYLSPPGAPRGRGAR